MSIYRSVLLYYIPLKKTALQRPGQQSEERNYLEQYWRQLEILRLADSKKCGSLIQHLNSKDPDLGLDKLTDIMGFKSVHVTYTVRRALSLLGHHLLYHKKEWDADFNSFKGEEEQKKFIGKLVKMLNKQSLMNLNRLYDANSEVDYWQRITELNGGQVMIKTVTDDNDVVIGYLPIVRLTLTIGDDKNETSHTLYISLERLRLLLDGLQRLYSDALDSTKNYKKQLGEMLLAYEVKNNE